VHKAKKEAAIMIDLIKEAAIMVDLIKEAAIMVDLIKEAAIMVDLTAPCLVPRVPMDMARTLRW
jgi:hypothetical protein